MKSFSILAILLAAVAATTTTTTTAAPSTSTACTEAQYQVVDSASKSSWYHGLCALSIGVSREALDSHQVLSEEAEAKFAESTTCKWLYGDIRKAAATQQCYELDLIAHHITWPMVVALMDVESYPKVNDTKCSKVQLTSAFAGLALQPTFYSCIGTSSKDLFTVPDHARVDAFRANPSCADLFVQLQEVVETQPHCAIDNKGTDIHVLTKLNWNVTLDWLAILGNATTAPSVPGAVKFAASSVHPSSQNVTGWLTATLAGVGVAVLAVVVLKKRRATAAAAAKRSEERIKLLRV
ncbi:hypothetical protein DYB25_013033 [Aphanomyces astaci]|uniref:Secreted protein n=1 Tax=Aphanomyces astaci TaxID=112090 RepID=A0A397FMS1_APHAT|nr:hypothetical protein DYB36_007089 [Aphanomyces astaci]RHY26920.1 hypothetical protein DYB25_013033 [Aphanomyces astaci]RHY70223.1 hypothetical protein DYB30_012697 [Aphanomyces astaci]RHY75228.1 hypothetical protein DYB34_010837 [Aphanomyces astaci]RHZ34176.1 hypothetical protein DYB31_015554 [Aphanomyces astaci]